MSRMRPVFFRLFLLFAVFLAAVPAWAGKAPDFRLRDVSSGEMIDTTNLRGRVVLVNFWATWCGPCRRGLPELERLYREYSGRGLTVIGVSVDRASSRAIAGFIKGMGITYPVVKATSSVSHDYGGVSAIPASFLIGPDGELVRKVRGYIPGARWRPYIENILPR